MEKAGHEAFGRGAHPSGYVAVLVGAGVCLLVFALYLRTLAPGVLYYDRPDLMDSAMLQVHAYTLGITHPTGYPTYLMLTHLFTYLPLGDVAYRANLASAVYAALAVGALYVSALVLTRRVDAAAAGALAFGTGATFWSTAVVAEVYSLNALLVLLPVICLLLWRERRRERRGDRYLLLAAFLTGLALTNHLTSGLVLPAGLLFVAVVDRRKFANLGLMLKGAGLFLLGLVPYAYLPVRGSADLPMRENDPTTFGEFRTLVSGRELTDSYLSLSPGGISGRLALFGDRLPAEFHWGLLIVAALGLAALLWRDRAVALFTGVLLLGWLAHSLAYDIFDVYLYFVPVYLVLGLWISVGVSRLLGAAENACARLPRIPAIAVAAALSAAALILPLASAADNYAVADRSRDHEGRRIIEAVARNVEPNATVLHNRSSLWYMVLVEERRRDLTLLDPFRPTDVRTHDLVWPDRVDPLTANLRWGTNDPTGVSAAREAARRGPFYMLDQESVNLADFLGAGFRIERVEEGILYELVPPEDG